MADVAAAEAAELGRAEKMSSAERLKAQKEWEKTAESLPDLINPLDLPDDVQLDMFDLMSTESENDSGNVIANMREIYALVPKFFKDQSEFEAWRRTAPVFGRAEAYMTILRHYIEALGEFGSSTK